MTIGKRIKQVREQLNLTMNELAERIGVATQTIFKYENEIRRRRRLWICYGRQQRCAA